MKIIVFILGYMKQDIIQLSQDIGFVHKKLFQVIGCRYH